MACQTGAPAPGSDPVDGDCQAGAQLPLARLAPPLSTFDPEGDVTQTGAESFWAWLDATPPDAVDCQGHLRRVGWQGPVQVLDLGAHHLGDEG